MKKSIKSATIFGGIVLTTIVAIFVIACLLMPNKAEATGASTDVNPAPITTEDSDYKNIVTVPNTKWGTDDYAPGCKLVYDRNTNIVMYKTYGYRGAADVLQPMLGPNGYPCRLEGSQIVETQTGQFVMSTE